MPLLFAVTLFVSAFLLFLVQPMIGKMILPSLGGTPAVWNTCMVFFQAVLLAGYFYTHSVTTWLPTRRQLLLQGGVLVLPLLFLPFTIGNWTPPTESNPVFALLFLLLLVVGIPFLVVATSAPLLQRWFSRTGHRAAKDPYFLYGASNLGSMLALLAYPALIEPNLPVSSQTTLWGWSYALFIVLTVACAAVVWVAPATAEIPGSASSKIASVTEPAAASPSAATAESVAVRPARRGWRSRKGPTQRLETRGSQSVGLSEPAVKGETPAPPAEVTLLRRLRWIGLAAVPSSLMLGVTTYLTTDIAAIPLFWIVPLALYLLSFILVFLRWPVEWTKTPHTAVLILQPLLLFGLALMNLVEVNTSQWVIFAINLLAFFYTALLCHGELARDRPSTRHLTEFYLWMSVGGMLGGMFNALVGPVVFNRHVEYMLVLAVGCLLRPPTNFLARMFGSNKKQPPDKLEDYFLDVGYAVCLGLFSFALLRLARAQNLWGEGQSFWNYLAGTIHAWGLFDESSPGYVAQVRAVAGWLYVGIVAGLPLIVCLVFAGRPLRFGLCAIAFFLVNGWYSVANEKAVLTFDGKVQEEGLVYLHRSFFGTQRIRVDKQQYRGKYTGDEFTVLIHGGIDHGRQNRDPAKRDRPISYFDPSGPIGQIFTVFKDQKEARPFGVIGLGVGTLASYARPKQEVDFYEIDPAVLHLSEPPDGQDPFFYYLRDARKRGVHLSEVKLGDGRLRLKEASKGYYHILVVDAFSSDAIPMHLLTLEALDLYLSKLAPGGILLFNVTNRYVDLPPALGDLAAARNLRCFYQGDYSDERTGKFAADWVVMIKPRIAPKDTDPKATDHKAVAIEAAQFLGGAPGLGGPLAVPWSAVAHAPQLDLPPLMSRLNWSSSPRPRYTLTDRAFAYLVESKVPEAVLTQLHPLKDKAYWVRDDFVKDLRKALDQGDQERFLKLVVESAVLEIWWEPCRQHHRPVWTDDYSNLLSVLTLGTDDYWILGIALLVGILLPFAVAGAEAGVIARRRQKAKLAAG